jgi:hypothetical protein
VDRLRNNQRQRRKNHEQRTECFSLLSANVLIGLEVLVVIFTRDPLFAGLLAISAILFAR